MTTLKTKKNICVLIGAALILSIQSCKKDKDKNNDTTTPAAQNGTVILHLHTNVDTNEVDYDANYLVPTHRKISVSFAQLFISGIQLIKTDNSTIDVPLKDLLKVQEIEEYSLGSVPAGNYKSIRFNVGLPAATNSIAPAGNDTVLNHPAMWFGTSAQSSGYIYVKFEGKIDTSVLANGAVAEMQAFQYHIGTNANLRTVTLPDQNYSVLPNNVQFIHITIDYNKLFTGIQLNNSANLMVNTVSDNTGTLGAQVTNNIPSMFRYEE